MVGVVAAILVLLPIMGAVYIVERESREYSQLIKEFKRNHILTLKEHCDFEKLLEAGRKLQNGERVIFTFSELCKLRKVELSCLVKGKSDKLSKYGLPEKLDLAQLYKTDAVEVERLKNKIILRPAFIEGTSEINSDLYVPLRDVLVEVFKDEPDVIVGETKIIK